jgi:hypothetical protein
MSMEIYVLSDRPLSSMDEWQRAIAKEGSSLRISADRPIETLKGHLPAWWEEKRVGFECDHWDVRQIMAEYPDALFGRPWAHALAFRWGADLRACASAYMAATADAAASEGVVFDCEELKIKVPKQARETVRKIEAELPMFEARMKEIVREIMTGNRRDEV